MESFITIVSGLPRSGTSMMMQMLEKGGQDLMVDGVRVADDDNPQGYQEFERIKKIEADAAWLSDAKGRVVKMVSTLIRNLPDGYQYKVVFMRRNLSEVIRSQEKMLLRRQTEGVGLDADKLELLYTRHLQDIYRWLLSKSNIDVMYIDYAGVLESPLEEARRVAEFLGMTTSIEPTIRSMAEAVNKSLYRNKVGEMAIN